MKRKVILRKYDVLGFVWLKSKQGVVRELRIGIGNGNRYRSAFGKKR
jgi:hypothetical protein